MLSRAVLAWSAVTAATPAVARTSVRLLLGARVLLGLCEGVTYPAIFHAFAELPPAEQPPAIGWINAGNGLGAVLAFACTPFMAAEWGWGSPFFAGGAAGVLWCVLWAAMVPEPGHSAAATGESRRSAAMHA